jgi:hypothetical protein
MASVHIYFRRFMAAAKCESARLEEGALIFLPANSLGGGRSAEGDDDDDDYDVAPAA